MQSLRNGPGWAFERAFWNLLFCECDVSERAAALLRGLELRFFIFVVQYE